MFELKHYEGSNFNASYYVPILKMYAEYWAETEESETEESEKVRKVGDKLEIILDGGIRRGTHVLKALSLGATACSFGKGFLFALGAGGQAGVEQILKRMREEIRRDKILLGCKSIKELNSSKIAYRWCVLLVWNKLQILITFKYEISKKFRQIRNRDSI